VQLRDTPAELHQSLPGGILAAIVDHYDFVRNTVKAQFEMKVFHGGADASFLIPRRYHHREKRERLGRQRDRSVHHAPVTLSHSG
jgi:hypothetical protein